MKAKYWIDKLNLKPHPEGGFFSEVYRSNELISAECLPERFVGQRNFATSIYYLLRSDEFSTLHRIKSDETWHFYVGTPLRILQIDRNGLLTAKLLGTNPKFDCEPQITIPFGCWFGAQPIEDNSYSLVGCTVSPGFDFPDFELANRAELLQVYPQHKETITKLTRE